MRGLLVLVLMAVGCGGSIEGNGGSVSDAPLRNPRDACSQAWETWCRRQIDCAVQSGAIEPDYASQAVVFQGCVAQGSKCGPELDASACIAAIKKAACDEAQPGACEPFLGPH